MTDLNNTSFTDPDIICHNHVHAHHPPCADQVVPTTEAEHFRQLATFSQIAHAAQQHWTSISKSSLNFLMTSPIERQSAVGVPWKENVPCVPQAPAVLSNWSKVMFSASHVPINSFFSR